MLRKWAFLAHKSPLGTHSCLFLAAPQHEKPPRSHVMACALRGVALKPHFFAALVSAAIIAPVSFNGAAHAESWTGKASFYSHGTRTASGAKFQPGALTAAHRSLPFGTVLRVTNLANQRSVLVTVNDRGPFIGGRILDLSAGAATVIGMRQSGVAQVHIERLDSVATLQ
jgi:rare lipoprotein A